MLSHEIRDFASFQLSLTWTNILSSPVLCTLKSSSRKSTSKYACGGFFTVPFRRNNRDRNTMILVIKGPGTGMYIVNLLPNRGRKKNYVRTARTYRNCNPTRRLDRAVARITTLSCFSAGSVPSSLVAKSITLVIIPLAALTMFCALAAPRVELLLKDASAAVVKSNW